jgi:CRISPR/Cas system CMR-associated protein Cmr3 (group 5 of RAMP superfamily)
MSAEAEAAPSGASSTNGTPQRADLDELLAQAELINDDELVEQLRAKKVRVKLAKKKKKKKKTNFYPLSQLKFVNVSGAS